jgi:hypothetical protein
MVLIRTIHGLMIYSQNLLENNIFKKGFQEIYYSILNKNSKELCIIILGIPFFNGISHLTI